MKLKFSLYREVLAFVAAVIDLFIGQLNLIAKWVTDSLLILIIIIWGILIMYGFNEQNEKNKLRFGIIKRVKESVKANDIFPVDSDWHILIHSPNRPAKKCKIWLNNTPLPWSDNNGLYYRNIPSGGGGNAMIPRNEFPEDTIWNAKGKIMEDKKIIYEFVFFYLDKGRG